MNIKSKRLLGFLGLVFFLISIPLTAYLVKQRQEIRGRAQEVPLNFTLNPSHPRLLVDAAEVEQIKEKIRTQTWARNNFAGIKRAAEARLAIPVNIPREAAISWRYLCPPDFTRPLDTNRSKTADHPTEHCCPLPSNPTQCEYWPDDYQVVPRPATCPGPSPVPETNRRPVTLEEIWRMGVHSRYLNDLFALALTYQFYDASPAVQPKEAYAQKARQILLEYARSYPALGLHDNSGCWNENSRNGAAKIFPETVQEAYVFLKPVIEAYDLLYDSKDTEGHDIFSAQDKTTIDNFVRQGVNTLRRYSYTNIGGNWQSANNAVIGLAGFLLNDQSLINEAIEGKSDGATVKSRGFKQQILEELGDDGFWPEGPGYHHVVLDEYINLAEAARHAGVDLYNLDVDPNPGKVKNFRMMFEMLKKMVMPNGALPGLEDSGFMFAPSTGFYDLAYTRFGDSFYPWYINKISNRSSMLSLLYGHETLPAGEYFTQSNILKNVGYGVLRAGTGDNTSYALLDFGPFGGHGHPDKLNLVFYQNGRLVMPDLGNVAYGSPLYTGWVKQTLAHNTFVVDGRSQAQVSGQLIPINGQDFKDDPNFKVIQAKVDNAYPNTTAKRILALNQDYLIDSLEVSSTNSQSHTYDLPFHGYALDSLNNNMALETNLSLTASTAGYNNNGYQYLTATQSATLSNSNPFWAKWKETIQSQSQAQEQVQAQTGTLPETLEAGGEPIDFTAETQEDLASTLTTAPSNLRVQVTGLSPASGDKVFSTVGSFVLLGKTQPFLIWRKTGINARFISLIESYTEGQRKISNIVLNGDVVTVTFANGRRDTFNLTTLTGSVITPSPTPTPTPLIGDIDRDGDVDIYDYNILVSHFGPRMPPGSPADLDHDGDVDIFDYNLLVSNF